MNVPSMDGGGRADGAAPTPVPHPSPRVRLEATLLDVGWAASTPGLSAVPDGLPGVTVLVVAAEADLRRYVRECLRERADLRVVDAATVGAAIALAAPFGPELLVVDEADRAVLGALSSHRAVLLVDEVPRGAFGAGRHVRLLACPFSAEALLSALAGLVEGCGG